MKEILSWLDLHIGTAQWITAFVTLLAVLGALVIGSIQNSINKKIEKIEDSVEIFGYIAYNKEVPVFLRITNVGKIQLYIQEYSLNGDSTTTPLTLIPAGQQQNAWYDIGLPKTLENTEIIIKMEDQLYRHWESKIKITKIGGGWSASVSRIRQI